MNRKTRRDFLKAASTVVSLPLLSQLPFLSAMISPSKASALTTQPNVLFITIDDLNDFASPFGGYSQILTPNMERLAKQSLVFQNAHTPWPECSGARTSFMTGIAQYRSKMPGKIFNISTDDGVKAALGINSLQTIPRYFKSKGYKTIGGGKLFHGGFGMTSADYGFYDQAAWDSYYNLNFSDIAFQFPGQPNYRDELVVDQATHSIPGIASSKISKMIGAYYNTPEQEAAMPDKLLAQWAEQQIKALSLAGTGQPFFMGIGFYRPHMAFYVPQRFYDMYPLELIRTQNFASQIDDLKDTPDFAIKNFLNGDQEDLQSMLLKNNRNGAAQAIQAYLASISFVDECLGQLLSALQRYSLASNTMIVLTSDHGWFLGEKLGWRKFRLYDRATRIPMMISIPGGPIGNTNQIASSLDLFPTMIDYTGGLNTVSADLLKQLDGKSLKPLLDNPLNINTNSYAISTYIDAAPSTTFYHSIRTSRWRYTAYPAIPGSRISEELFDLTNDVGETRNLMYWEPERYAAIRNSLRDILLNRVGAA